MVLKTSQMYKSNTGASSSLVMLPRQPSLPEGDSLSEDEGDGGSIIKAEVAVGNRVYPSSPPSASYSAAISSSLYRGSPMARSSSQQRISQELNFGSGNALSVSPRGLRTPTTDEYRFPSASTPTRQIPLRRNSSRTSSNVNTSSSSSNGLSNSSARMNSLAAQRDYFGSDFSIASESTKVPFPKSTGSISISSHSTIETNNLGGYLDSPSAKRIARHVSSLNGGAAAVSVESINLIPASPTKENTSPITIPSRPTYRHLRYSSELNQNRNQISVAPSRSDITMEEKVGPHIDSEVNSLYSNTLGSYTTEDVSAYSGLRSAREASQSAVPPSKHKLIVVEDGKPNVTYQMGNCIGRGQFGSVYRALNLNTGQMVAVKRIKIEGLAEDEVTQLMGEVDLLKSLSHPSVVKYEGLVRGPEVVSIILEFVENGSLLHTLKAFGNFPEKLVASYVVKILEGLNYLHEMKVVHCDLKAANILTTKNGNVKLSDFGVSLNLQAVKNIKNDAIGTPNWMAPEVIELKGASFASDIWSLGCTIIELLTGKPPYGDMLAMSALWRIVEDDCPPFPDKISQPLRNFLTLCFKKDPALRPSADQLFEHEWLRKIWHTHLALRPQDSVPFLRRINAADVRANQISILSRNQIVSMTTSSSQSQMERSSSSPPASLSVRPHLISLRAASAPDAWSMQESALEEAGLESINSEQASPLTPSVYPFMSFPSPMSLVDLTLRRGSDPMASFDILRSPSSSLVAEKGTNVQGVEHPSYLDLNAADVYSLEDQNKQHAFVKITFAKAAVCRICRDAVKKHAVLCEECGLICHASCTKKSIAPCNLRAQLLLYAANGATRASIDQVRGASPVSRAGAISPAFSSNQETPPVSPRLFKIPFGRTRKTSGAANFTLSNDVQDTSTSSATTLAVPTTPTTPQAISSEVVNESTPSSPLRKRRFSLRPYLTRKASPIRVEEVSMTRSLSSPRSMSGDAGRTDSLGYGSSISSLSSGIPGGAKSLTKTDTSTSNSGSPLPTSINAAKKQQHRHSINVMAAASTPHLLNMDKIKLAEQKAKRRQSATPQRVTTPMEITLSSRVGGVYDKSTSNNNSNNIASPTKRSRRLSSKQDCIVM